MTARFHAKTCAREGSHAALQARSFLQRAPWHILIRHNCKQCLSAHVPSLQGLRPSLQRSPLLSPAPRGGT